MPRGILKSILIWLRNYFVVIGVLATVIPIIFVYSVAKLAKSHAAKAAPEVVVQEGSELYLDLSGPLQEGEAGFTDALIARFMGGERGVRLPVVRAALRKAEHDERIKGLTIEIGAVAGGSTAFVELRRLVEQFQGHDKKVSKSVTVMIHDATDWGYYLASVADHLVLNPASPVSITGPVFNLMYFGEALRKVGVSIEVVRAGKYKSAFEPLVLDQPSEATLEEYSSMNRAILDHLVDAVARGRKKKPEEVRAWYKQSIFTAKDALDQGLVDAIGYADDAAPAGGGKAAPRVKLADYSDSDVGSSLLASAGGSDGIAVIDATGEIHMEESDAGQDDIAPRTITKRIRWAKNDPKVKAVVLRVSSPGGSAIASEMIWHEIKALTDAKPVVVSMGQYAASGGYYISAPAKMIFAEPTTLTGSIGVIGMIPSFEAFKEKYGVSFHIVTESDRRFMLNPGSKSTAFDKQLVESTIDQVYKQFLARVAAGRNIPVEKVAELAQGRVYTGAEGKALGLVDEIGGLSAAMGAAKKLAGFDADKLYPILRYEDDEMDFGQCFGGPSKLMRCFGGGGAHVTASGWSMAPDAVTDVALKVKGWVDETSHEHALALWPGYVSLRSL